MKPRPVQIICLLILCLLANKIKAQDASVEKSLYGIQTGFWGFWFYNESKLSPKWALRTEVGLFDYFGIAGGINLEPVISLAPRWYFNRERRLEKGKRIDANSGSFVALKTSLRPSIFSIPVDTDLEQERLSVSFVPTIGARKNIGEKFNYELGVGFGVEYFSKGGYDFSFFSIEDENETDSKIGPAFNIHLRIGYKL